MTAIRTSGEPCGPGEFTVDSATMPGERWLVVYRTSDVSWCACPSFQHRSTCRHLEQVALALEIEVRQSFARSTPESRAAAERRLAHIAQEFDCR